MDVQSLAHVSTALTTIRVCHSRPVLDLADLTHVPSENRRSSSHQLYMLSLQRGLRVHSLERTHGHQRALVVQGESKHENTT